jgi:hypothetical protein
MLRAVLYSVGAALSLLAAMIVLIGSDGRSTWGIARVRWGPLVVLAVVLSGAVTFGVLALGVAMGTW